MDRDKFTGLIAEAKRAGLTNVADALEGMYTALILSDFLLLALDKTHTDILVDQRYAVRRAIDLAYS